MSNLYSARLAAAVAMSAVSACYTGLDGPDLSPTTGDTGDTGDTGETVDPVANAKILIRVRDAHDAPIPFAPFRTAGVAYRTDHQGHFLLDVLPGHFVATVEVRGYAPATIAVDVPDGARMTATARVLSLGERIRVRSDEPADVTRNGVHLVLPANAVADPDHPGNPLPAGTELDLTIVALDPVVDRDASPGPLIGVGTDGKRIPLESVFMAEISIWHDGRRLQLLKPAQLELTVPLGHPTELPAQMPAWWFDHDSGTWRQDGEGTFTTKTVDGQLRTVWAAEISHLTWWNADVPLDQRNCIAVTIVDTWGKPIVFKPVTATGITYAGYDTEYTDIKGHACLEMKKGADQQAKVFVGEIGNENDPLPPADPKIVDGKDVASWCGGPVECIAVQLKWKDEFKQCDDGQAVPCGDPYSGPPNTQGIGIC